MLSSCKENNHFILYLDDKFHSTIEAGHKHGAQIFDIFSYEFSLFVKTIEFLGLNKVNWVEKRLKSCEKMSKICEMTMSADVVTTIQNLKKHSTVQPFCCSIICLLCNR